LALSILIKGGMVGGTGAGPFDDESAATELDPRPLGVDFFFPFLGIAPSSASLLMSPNYEIA
jgi:hypothetical protein